MDLSVVVPVHNEAGNIDPLLQEIHDALEGQFDFQAIFVDDGSRDGTATELAAARTRFPRLRVVTHRDACGQSAALRTGVKAASAGWIATLDGDGQNDPADIPRLVEAVRGAPGDSGLRMVAGYRRTRRDSWIKRVSSRIANSVRSWLLGDATPDTGCGLKVFSRAIFLDLPYFDHMHRFLPALVQRAGWRVISMEVRHRHRARGRSKYGTLDRLVAGVIDLLGVMWLKWRSRVPEIVESPDALE